MKITNTKSLRRWNNPLIEKWKISTSSWISTKLSLLLVVTTLISESRTRQPTTSFNELSFTSWKRRMISWEDNLKEEVPTFLSKNLELLNFSKKLYWRVNNWPERAILLRNNCNFIDKRIGNLKKESTLTYRLIKHLKKEFLSSQNRTLSWNNLKKWKTKFLKWKRDTVTSMKNTTF